MRSRLVTNLVLAGSIVMVAIGVPARGEADCPTAEWVCDFWPKYLGLDCEEEPKASCEDEDCIMGAYGDEVFVLLSSDPEVLLEDGYSKRFLVMHEATITNLSCEPIDHPHGYFLEMPAQGHCAIRVDTGDDDDYYMEFFASYPDTPGIPGTACHGWVECACVDVEDDD